MACLAMHLAIAEEYIKRNNIKDRNAFLDGTLAPDFTSDKIASHFGNNENPKTAAELLQTKMNLSDYVNKSQIISDFDKGYFLHMITDDLFYQCIYSEKMEEQTLEQISADGYDDFDFVTRHILSHYKIEVHRISRYKNNRQGSPIYFNIKECNAFIKAAGKINLEKAKKEILTKTENFREKFFTKNKIKIKRLAKRTLPV